MRPPSRSGEPPRFRIPDPIRSGRNGGRSMRERRRKFTPEFKDEAVKMVIESSRPIAEVAREIQVNEGTLGNWVHKYRLDHVGEEPPLSISDRARLRELERENRPARDIGRRGRRPQRRLLAGPGGGPRRGQLDDRCAAVPDSGRTRRSRDERGAA